MTPAVVSNIFNDIPRFYVAMVTLLKTYRAKQVFMKKYLKSIVVYSAGESGVLVDARTLERI